MDTAEQEEMQLYFFGFTCSQFNDEYEGALRAKLCSLLKNTIWHTILAKDPNCKDTLEVLEAETVNNLLESLQPFCTAIKEQFSECFHIDDKIPMFEDFHGTSSAEEVSSLKSDLDNMLKSYLTDEVMINAITHENETHTKLLKMIDCEQAMLKKATNLDSEPITVEDVQNVVSNILV